MSRVFSGVQPTGNIHIGNYLGALKQFVDLQKEENNECIYCIVDMHAITVPQDPKILREHILDVAALYMAIGVDPKKNIVFVQSDVKQHAELGWILNCNTYMGELARMTQYKQKKAKSETPSVGLFDYPVLMASDILLYDTDIVPVGNDQKQHIELARNIAIRVNNKYGKTFVVPDGKFVKAGARIMSLDDPTAKMSKSNPNEKSRICLLDDPSKIKKAIMSATTDSEGIIRHSVKEKPGVSNLLNIYSAFTGKSIASLEEEYKGHGYGDLKKDLVEVTVDALTPIRERYEQIRHSEELLTALRDGAQRAEAIAEKTIVRVKNNFGLGF